MISIIEQKDIENSINNNLGNDFIQFVFGKTSPIRIHSEFIGLGYPREDDTTIKIATQYDFDCLTDRRKMLICDIADSYDAIDVKMEEPGIQLHV